MPNIIDKYARHAHYLEQYYNRVERGLNPFLNRVAKKLRLELTQTQTVNSAKRKQALLDFTESLMKAELTGFTDELTQQIELFSESEAEFAVNTLNKTGDDIGMVLPTPNQLHTAVYARPFNNRLLKDYLKEFTSTQARQVRDAVSMGFFEGKPTSQIIQEIVGTKSQNYKNGILNVTRTSGGRMVRTALAHTAAVSKNRTFEQNIDITPYYEWVSVLDGRTSAICKALDGNVYQVGKGRLPPAHPNCRSVTSPLFKNEVNKTKSGLTRIGKDTGAGIHYNDWLKKQSKQFQIDTLGKTKADLFRKGGLSVDKFVNNRGQELTLDQLKEKYPTEYGKI